MRFAVAMAALVVASIACTETDSETSDGGTFTPVQSDFQSFHAWQSFTFQGAAIPDSPHSVAGQRTDYLNHVPPKGATAFPVGTIIVKEFDSGPVAGRQVFAMVKVGGDYNAQGAAGWEWFELTNNVDGSESIHWDGVGAPPGDVYANSPITCNECHANAKNNDYVQSQALQLPALELSDGGSVGNPAASPDDGGDE
jgi:hypothetical protein